MKHKVLFVDDEPHILDGMKRVLHHEPYEILTATSGEEGLDILSNTAVDVVIADQEMPGMSGTKFLQRVRKDYPDAVRFILTGKATLEIAINAINEGAVSRFFTKPVQEVNLRFAIRQALQHKDLTIEARRLLQKVKLQASLLDEIEETNPGISELRKERAKYLKVERTPANFDDFIKEIRGELAR